MNALLGHMGTALTRYLSRPVHIHSVAPAASAESLLANLQPGDVLLIEGNSRISSAIKYLTQSTWSHAAVFVGFEPLRLAGRNASHCLIDADTVEGVRSVSIKKFAGLHTRICRPVGLLAQDKEKLIENVIQRLGHRYDLRNLFDLARYLLPTLPVPQRWRRHLIYLGSGDPTRAICSTMIAQAFQSIRYPILPIVEQQSAERPDCPACVEEILRIRHHSLFTPRDFDVSPYFEIVKPAIGHSFDYTRLHWQPVSN